MARSILAKSASKLNYNSRRHILLYQKVLYTGSRMAYLINDYYQYIGLSKEVVVITEEWSLLMKRLAEVML